MKDATVHSRRASTNGTTTPFGIRVPKLLLHDFEAARLRYRPEIPNRQDAIVEAMRAWIEHTRAEGERSALPAVVPGIMGRRRRASDKAPKG